MELYLRSIVGQFQKPYLIFGLIVIVFSFWGLARLVKSHRPDELYHLLQDKTFKKSFRFFRTTRGLIKKMLQALILSLIILVILGGFMQNSFNQVGLVKQNSGLEFYLVKNMLFAFSGLTYGASLILVFAFARATRKQHHYSYCFKTKDGTEKIPAETEVFLDSRLDKETYLCVYFDQDKQTIALPLGVNTVRENEFYRSQRFDWQKSWYKQLTENLLASRKISRHVLILLLTLVLTFLFMYLGAALAGGIPFNAFGTVFTSTPVFYWLSCGLPALFYLLLIVSMAIMGTKKKEPFKHEAETEVKKPRRKKTKST